MSGDSHSCLKFHVYVGGEIPGIAGVSRKRVQLSYLVLPLLYHVLLFIAIDGEFLEVPLCHNMRTPADFKILSALIICLPCSKYVLDRP